MTVAIRALLMAAIASCATGGMPIGNGGDDVPAHDAPPASHRDAPQVTGDSAPPIDAAVAPDAFVFHDAPIDAASAVFCTANNECTNSGQCCIRLGLPTGLCGNGIPIGTECVPQ